MITTNDMVLKIEHNAGFFSCCSIALENIMQYYNQHEKLPDAIDRSVQYLHYKEFQDQDISNYFFGEGSNSDGVDMFEWTGEKNITLTGQEPQYSDYKKILHHEVKPFIERYFEPSSYVIDKYIELHRKYQIDTKNTCAIFDRGNDKNRETKLPSYNEVINKAHEIKESDPGIKFLVLPDEQEFLNSFLAEFPDSVWFEEKPPMNKMDSALMFETPLEKRPEHGLNFFASVLILSQCKHLITHSGNGGIWSVLYRGHSQNVHQWLNDKWLS